MPQLPCFLMFGCGWRYTDVLGIRMWGHEDPLSTWWTAIAVVLGEDPGAIQSLTWSSVCHELLELDLPSFKEAFPLIISEDLLCGNIACGSAVYNAHSQALSFDLHRSSVGEVGIILYRRGDSGLGILIGFSSCTPRKRQIWSLDILIVEFSFYQALVVW